MTNMEKWIYLLSHRIAYELLHTVLKYHVDERDFKIVQSQMKDTIEKMVKKYTS